MTVNVWKSYYVNASIFMSLSAVHIYDFHIFTVICLSLHGFVWNQHNDQLPVGLQAKLVELCTGIAKVMGSNPIQAWIFFRPYFHYCSRSVHYCKDCFHIHVFSTLVIANTVDIFELPFYPLIKTDLVPM